MGGSVLGVTLLLVPAVVAPSVFERFYVEGIGYASIRVLTALTAPLPFSVAEVVEVVLGLVVLAGLAISAVRVRRGTWTRQEAAWIVTTSLGSAISVGVFLFYLVWGGHYARRGAAERLGWEPADPTTASLDEVETVTQKFVDVVNAHYELIHGTIEADKITGLPSPAAADEAIDQGYLVVARKLDLPPAFSTPRGRAKPLASSPLFSWLGVSGYFFPFTGEANVNTGPPGWRLPHTIAHEKAHQRGLASEDEANFFGFLATIHSDDVRVRYAGYLFAQRQFLRVLLYRDDAVARRLIEARHPGVQRDVDASILYWMGYRGAGMELGSAVNDAYLRINQVEGGTAAYARSCELALAWVRRQGGAVEAQP
jgi:hypothetical protein